LPDEAGPWASARRDDQREAFDYVATALAALPVLGVPLQPRDVSGLTDLAALGGLAYGGRDPAAVLHSGPAQAFSRDDGSYVLSLALPFVEREELMIERLDDALIVHVGERSRTFDLPDDVREMEGVTSAFDSGTLRVTFSQR
jgi:arsenite-transporting ATPase